MTTTAALNFSAFEKLGLLLKTIATILFAIKDTVYYPYATSPKPPLKTYINNSVIRNLLQWATPRELQSIMPPSLATYNDWAKKKGHPPNIEEIDKEGDNPSTLVWLGPVWEPGSKGRVLFYVHGGGFQLPMSGGHLDLCEWVRNEVKKHKNDSGGEMFVAMLVYSLTPEHRYPTQFVQAVVALQALLGKGLSPDSIMLAGDSAGGHILLSVISHILHPHPSAPALRVTSPFRCTILISPAVAAKGTSSSMQENGYLDIINQALVYRWFDMLMEATPFEEEVKAGKFWGTSLEAPVEWWNGLTTAVQKVFLTTGQCEILKDDIIAFGEKLQTLEELNRVEGLKVFIGENEIHDAPLDDFSFGRGFSGSTKMFAQWATEAFNDST